MTNVVTIQDVSSSLVSVDLSAMDTLVIEGVGAQGPSGSGGAGAVTSVAGRTGDVVLTKTDVSLANVDNTSDVNKPVSTAQASADALRIPLTYLDTDGTLTANSDTKIATQKAVKTYTDNLIAANDAMVYKGVIDCSANPNYPAASAGHLYKISVAGKIGGASGSNVEVGDSILCTLDGSASGNQAAVGANWNVIQVNIDGAVIGPSSSTDNAIARFDLATGKLLQNSGATIDDSGNIAATNLSGTNTGNETTTTEGALINGATSKATPVDADYIGLMDSAASNILKKLSWANIKATLKIYFDTLYYSIAAGIYDNGNSGTSATVAFNNGTLQKITITGAVAIALTAPSTPRRVTLLVTQNATGFAYSLPAGIIWVGGVPTLSSTANKKDSISLIYDGATYWGMAGVNHV